MEIGYRPNGPVGVSFVRVIPTSHGPFNNKLEYFKILWSRPRGGMNRVVEEEQLRIGRSFRKSLED
jgi:hypothetical protein